MVKRPALSKSEFEIAKLIWELGEGTVGQIYEALPGDRQIDYTTVQTYIRRLETKGYLTSRREGRNKIYRAKVRPGQVIGETVRDFMDRLFDGNVTHFVRHLIDQQAISEEELSQLRELIDTQQDAEDVDDE